MLVFIFIISTLADHIAAFVGNDVVLESEVRDNMALLVSNPAAQQLFSNIDELRDYVLSELISQKLILAEAKKESIAVNDEEVEAIAKSKIDEIKERYPSEAQFLKDLQDNNLTLEELSEYHEKTVRAQLIIELLIKKKIGTKITISPSMVRKFYEENKDSIAVRPGRVKLAHILLAIKPSETELKKSFERALEIYKLLYTGGDFSVIAQEFSEDENSKYKGGMLGKIKRGETLEEFESVIFDLKPGVVSQPFPTRLGYHIVEVLNRGVDWVLLRQILIKVEISKADTLSYEQLAKKFIKLINQGADFDSLAKAYSDDPTIDLGEFYIKQLSPLVDEIVENMKPGQLSEPILTPYGYHQIYLREKISEKPLTFEELRDQIYNYISQREFQKYINQLVDELKEKTFVKIFPKGQ
jgi:peptidyl-prolyl cis-trans isomerase SurA